MGAHRVSTGTATLGWKALGTVLLLAVIGLPITSLGDLVVFAGTWLALLFSPVRASLRPPPGWRWGSPVAETLRTLGVLAAVVLGTAGVKLALPNPQIEEGQGLFVPGRNDTYGSILPAPVADRLRKAYEAHYPPAAQCTDRIRPCWTDQISSAPASGYAFGSESLLSGAQTTRRVTSIGFTSRRTLPLIAANDLRYNFYPPLSPDWVQLEAPYYLRYEIPAAFFGGRLCWRGAVFVEAGPGTYRELSSPGHPRCSTLGEGTNRSARAIRLYAVETSARMPLAMHLEPPPLLGAAQALRTAAGQTAALLVLLCLCPRLSMRRLALPLGSLFATIAWAQILAPESYTGFRLHYGGSDGLGYEAFARQMVESAALGDWSSALRGGEAIFWSMPGLRYFLASMKPLFGDTFFAYSLACMFLPIVLYGLLRHFLSPRAARISIVLYLFTPLLEYFRFTHYIYVKLAVEKGLAETLGYLCMLAAMLVAFRALEGTALRIGRTGEPPPPGLQSGAHYTAIGFLCFAAVAMRPNLGPSAALLLVATGLALLRARALGRVALLCLGFAPIGLLGLHNWHFGGEFYLLTMTGTHPANLEMPPSRWLAALGDLLAGAWRGEALERALRHLRTWNSIDEFYRVIMLGLVVWVASNRQFPAAHRLLAWLALSQQATLFFFHASGRYAFLAWALTFLAFLPLWTERLWPALQRRLRLRPGASYRSRGCANLRAP